MRALLFFVLIFSFQVHAEIRIVSPVDKNTIIDDGKCFRKVEDPYIGSFHWVLCKDSDDDIGFNKPNCELINGTWRESDESCLQEILSEHGLIKRYRWYMENGQTSIR